MTTSERIAWGLCAATWLGMLWAWLRHRKAAQPRKATQPQWREPGQVTFSLTKADVDKIKAGGFVGGPVDYHAPTEHILELDAATLTIRIEREVDGRWIASAPELPGVLVYGETEGNAIDACRALARSVLAEQRQHAPTTRTPRKDRS